MKRVLTLATTGLFVTGLALLPISGRADPAAADGKSVTPAPAVTTMTPGKTTSLPSAQPTTASVKKDDKKVTATPSVAPPSAAGTAVKTPAKGAS
jgi:hypothetical protein